MKIGVFDSGLGGLIITHSLTQALPEYDYLYLGDAARVPYGNRSAELVYQFTRAAVDYLFAQDCGLIIIACNTASAEALRKIQREYLPKHYPDRRVIGVLVPTAEVVADHGFDNVGVIATAGTAKALTYTTEIQKIRPEAQIHEVGAPLLVPLIESDGLRWVRPILESYLEPLLAANIEALILGCTHFPVIKSMAREIVGDGVQVISQDELIPAKLTDYLERHPQIENTLSRGGSQRFLITDMTLGAEALATRLFEAPVTFEAVDL